MDISRKELKELIREVAYEAAYEGGRAGCRETLTQLGFDVDKPLDMQKDFQALRSWRISADVIQKKALRTVVGLVVVAVLGAIWIGIKASIGK